MNAAAPVLDLAERETYQLLERLYYSCWASRIRDAGIEEEDGFQTVCEVLLRRQTGRSRWDPSRAALVTYLYVVTRSAVLNLIDSHRRAVHRNGLLGIEGDVAMQEELAGDQVQDLEVWEEVARMRGLTLPELMAVAQKR